MPKLRSRSRAAVQRLNCRFSRPQALPPTENLQRRVITRCGVLCCEIQCERYENNSRRPSEFPAVADPDPRELLTR